VQDLQVGAHTLRERADEDRRAGGQRHAARAPQGAGRCLSNQVGVHAAEQGHDKLLLGMLAEAQLMYINQGTGAVSWNDARELRIEKKRKERKKERKKVTM
jgi:hypothetical protein